MLRLQFAIKLDFFRKRRREQYVRQPSPHSINKTKTRLYLEIVPVFSQASYRQWTQQIRYFEPMLV